MAGESGRGGKFLSKGSTGRGGKTGILDMLRATTIEKQRADMGSSGQGKGGVFANEDFRTPGSREADEYQYKRGGKVAGKVGGSASMKRLDKAPRKGKK